MLISVFLVAAGLVLLFVGGEALVRGSVIMAHTLKLPKLLIGLIVVGFGTSMPELLVSVQAAFGGAPELALGNVVGSNVANVLLIIGAAAVLAPMAGWKGDATRGALVATGAAGVLLVVTMQDTIGHLSGALMLALLALYLAGSYYFLSRHPDATEDEDSDNLDAVIAARTWAPPVVAVAGIALLVTGADLLITGAVTIARSIGISDAVIGLSLVAFGTSLPELVTAIVSSIKRQSEVIIGSIIGSNIFNILAILGITVTLHPISVADRIPAMDAPLVLATSIGMFLLLALTRSIGRSIGIAMLALYGGYMVILFTQGAVG